MLLEFSLFWNIHSVLVFCYAVKILPVVRNQHLLLCTLLICNAAAMEVLLPLSIYLFLSLSTDSSSVIYFKLISISSSDTLFILLLWKYFID